MNRPGLYDNTVVRLDMRNGLCDVLACNESLLGFTNVKQSGLYQEITVYAGCAFVSTSFSAPALNATEVRPC